MAVWAHSVVVLSPAFDKYLGFQQRVEPFTVKQLIAKLAVEALDGAILPRISGLDEQRLYFHAIEPIPHFVRSKLRSLSLRMYFGTPRQTNKSLNRANTSSLVSLLVASIAKHSRVHSPIMVNIRNVWPLLVQSVKKS